MSIAGLIFLAFAVYRLSLFSDDPRLLKKLKKIHESFASPAFASIWIAGVLAIANMFLHEFLLFQMIVMVFGLSGITCVLSQLQGKPQFILPLPRMLPPGDQPPKTKKLSWDPYRP